MRAWPLAVLFLVGCGSSDSLSRYVGRQCTVRVRPATLGFSGNVPVSLQTDSLNGGEVAVYGKLVSVDDRWVLLEKNDKSEILVARDSVLSVGVEPVSPP